MAFELRQTGYSPIGFVWPRQADARGVLVAHPNPAMPSLTPAARIDRHLIPLAEGQGMLAGRFNILPIGRSGFTNEDDARHFEALMEGIFDGSLHLLRRAGIDPSSALVLTTSATGGTVDMGVRRVAALHRVPTLAFICASLMCYVDPRDPYIPSVINTDAAGRDYSELSISLSDVVLSLPGGGFALFNDLPFAIAQGKETVVVYDPSVNHRNVSVTDGSLLIGNHGVTLVHEQRRVTKSIQRALRKEGQPLRAADMWDPNHKRAQRLADMILGRSEVFGKLVKILAAKGLSLSPQQLFAKVRVIERPHEWAQYLYGRLGGKGRMEDAVSIKTVDPVVEARQSLAGAKMILSITGRSQWINKTSGTPESHHIGAILRQLSEMLCDRLGLSRRDIGVVHGMSNYGADGMTLREFVLKGHPALGVVKPEWANWTDAVAKGKSDYILTPDTYEAFSAGYVGDGLGFRSDAIIVFEGNAGVKSHIKKAVSLGIPVIVVPLTDDPMFGDFYDVQKAKMFPDRLLNIGKWVFQAERDEALEYLIKRVGALLETDVDFNRRNAEREAARLRRFIEAVRKSAAREESVLKNADGLLGEVEDLLDASTTVENNPHIMVARTAEEIMGVMEALWLQKKSALEMEEAYRLVAAWDLTQKRACPVDSMDFVEKVAALIYGRNPQSGRRPFEKISPKERKLYLRMALNQAIKLLDHYNEKAKRSIIESEPHHRVDRELELEARGHRYRLEQLEGVRLSIEAA